MNYIVYNILVTPIVLFIRVPILYSCIALECITEFINKYEYIIPAFKMKPRGKNTTK